MTNAVARLPGELLRHVLDELEPNPDEPIPVNCRRFLSQESLDRPSPPPRSCVEDIANFRLACKQFAEVGAPLLFTRVVLRLSKRDLERLERLSEWPVAAHVKRFSYLVPYFFENRRTPDELPLPRAPNGFSTPNFKVLQRKQSERQQILIEREDARVLKKAIAAFSSLQHIRILPLADEEQNKLLRLMRQEPGLSSVVDLDWTVACYHCSRTVGNALLDANLQSIRFSYPKIKPQDALYFASQKLDSISNIAATLTSLTLQFEEVNALDQEVSQLSRLFKAVFSRAVNMEAIHVGFMSPRPLELPLEDVFQDITWPKLVALGIHGWNLHAEDILKLALRHKTKLKGLRLRSVFLRDGSTWKHVLSQIKQSMRLTWISLTGIGYAGPPPSGAEETEVMPSDDESDDDNEPEDFLDAHGGLRLNGSHAAAGAGASAYPSFAGPSDFSEDDFYGDSNSDDDGEGGEHPLAEIEFLDLGGGSEREPPSILRCNCDESDPAAADDALDDDGGPITGRKAKRWEKWVVNRCYLHGPR